MAKKKPDAKANDKPAAKKPTPPKAAAAPKPKKATKAQRMNALDDKAGEVMTQFRRFKLAESSWDAAHAEAGSAKKEMELQQEKLNALIQEMSDISSGKTKLLPFTHWVPTGGTPQPSTAEDIGGKKPLTILIGKNLKKECPSHHRDGVGLSEAQVETLSKAIDGEKTIANLEKFQRTNPIWTRSMNGFGEAAITKLQDAHEIVRRAFPIPSPDEKATPPSNATETIADKLNKLEPTTAAKA